MTRRFTVYPRYGAGDVTWSRLSERMNEKLKKEIYNLIMEEDERAARVMDEVGEQGLGSPDNTAWWSTTKWHTFFAVKDMCKDKPGTIDEANIDEFWQSGGTLKFNMEEFEDAWQNCIEELLRPHRLETACKWLRKTRLKTAKEKGFVLPARALFKMKVKSMYIKEFYGRRASKKSFEEIRQKAPWIVPGQESNKKEYKESKIEQSLIEKEKVKELLETLEGAGARAKSRVNWPQLVRELAAGKTIRTVANEMGIDKTTVVRNKRKIKDTLV